MPTTILFGETYEQARERRFREEAAIDAKIAERIASETLCWSCSSAYPKDVQRCPTCKASNANINPEAAMMECLS